VVSVLSSAGNAERPARLRRRLQQRETFISAYQDTTGAHDRSHAPSGRRAEVGDSDEAKAAEAETPLVSHSSRRIDFRMLAAHSRQTIFSKHLSIVRQMLAYLLERGTKVNTLSS